VLLRDPDAQVQFWRKQLGLILKQASETIQELATQAAESHVRSPTRTRIRELARSIAEQAEDIRIVLEPRLGPALPPHEGVGLPRGATDYISYLFRDWAWADGKDDENERAVTAIRRVARGQALGRTLVLGAGACRLAYDLHAQGASTETSAVDIDPYLLVVAEAVIRGGAVCLTETSVNSPEIKPVARRWTLCAPSGPLGAEAFHFYVADGTAPPFADETFDTVVTPWFIDQVPTDLEDFLHRAERLLVPGGRWINRGPLLYRPDKLPITRWYSRDEVFDLASSIGFRIGAWESASQAYLVSPLNGRGLIENVLTFEARRDA
jgi:SAM-dependent methyltransferase